jgi:hypothetical protein
MHFMLIHNRYTIIYLLIFFFIACKKEKNPISDTPEIAFVSVTPATLQAYNEKLTFTISYIDGDGDLGENNADAKNFFLVDNRNNVTYHFRIPELAPTGSGIAIKGNLNVSLDNAGLSGDDSVQIYNYTIYVKDRAGHESNRVGTSPVTVLK